MLFQLRFFTFLSVMFVCSSAWGQFERIDAVIAKIDAIFAEKMGFLPTPENAGANMIKEEDKKFYLTAPMTWELEKVRMRETILNDKLAQREKLSRDLAANLEKAEETLASMSIRSEADLQNRLQESDQLNRELATISAEIGALKSVAEKRAASRLKELEALEREAAQHEIEAQVKSLNDKLDLLRTQYSKGLVTSAEVHSAESNFKTKQLELQWYDKRNKRLTAESEIVPGLSDELTKALAMQKELQARLSKSSIADEELDKIKKSLSGRSKIQIQYEFITQELEQLSATLEQVELEKSYLELMLNRYEPKKSE